MPVFTPGPITSGSMSAYLRSASHSGPIAGGTTLATTAAVGVFAGARFGWPDLAVSPELGVFYSPSPLFRDDDLIIVPSVTVRGDRLRRALGL